MDKSVVVSPAAVGYRGEKPKPELRGWWWVVGQGVSGVAYPIRRERLARLTHDSSMLKVDVDGQRKLSPVQLAERLKKNNRWMAHLIERRSPSGRGWHRWIGVWPRPASAVEMVALQLLCGSDPHREAYNLNRARQVDAGTVSDYWKARWNTLYRKEHNARRR